MIYAVGDIHGQRDMLAELLASMTSQPLCNGDSVVFLGDYIDRGPQSKDVIEILLEFQGQQGNCIFLRGNHEQMMLDSRDGPPPIAAGKPDRFAFSEVMAGWFENGGLDTLRSYPVKDVELWWESIPDAHWKFIEATEMEYVTDRYHFVHAGLLSPGEAWEGELWGLDPRLWIREQFLESNVDFEGRIVVFGHTPQRTGQPLILPNKIGLDTAAAYGGPLTAAALDPDNVGPPHFFQAWPGKLDRE